MRKRLHRTMHLKNKRFLKSFFISMSLILSFGSVIAFWGYQTSNKALTQEVNQMNYRTATELCSRMENALEQGNRLASRLVTDQRIQMFFSHVDPEGLFDSYYLELKGKLNLHGLSYVDSVILYSPKLGRIFDTSEGEVKNLPDAKGDLSWLEQVTPVERTTTTYYVREKDTGWPYYYSIVKHYRYGAMDGVVVININLLKLHTYLLADREHSLELFVVDSQQRVMIRNEQMTLFSDPEDITVLSHYVPGKAFAELSADSKNAYAYAQVYSETYGFTVVTVTQLGDYMSKLMEMRGQFLLVLAVVAVIAMVVACIYSIILLRPIQYLKSLLEDPRQWDRGRQAEDIQEVADQIISHLQTNKLLRQELDSRLDLLNRTQIQALQAQINPHFLFNTLNVVSLMLERKVGEEDSVVQVVEELSDILRYSLSDNGIVSIKEEVAYARKYLSILQVRFDKFDSMIRVEEALNDCAIPRLVLQPLIENAVQHGRVTSLKSRKGSVTVDIHQIQEEGRPMVCVEIRDNGLGMHPEKLAELRDSIQNRKNVPAKHIGVVNVALRFYLNFHNDQKMSIESTPENGTGIRIVFPLVKWTEE